MSKVGKRLGRGLDSLISNLRSETQIPLAHGAPHTAITPPPTASGSAEGVKTLMIAPDQLSPNPFQPRHEITAEDLISMGESIRRHGLLQPISVRSVGGKFEIIAGERRWQAAKSIALRQVPVIVRQASDEQMLELALIENLEREDLNAIDRARAYRQFCTHFGLRPDEVADRLGEDRSTVANYLRLLDLSEPIRAMVAAGRLGMGHARCLLGEENEVARGRLADLIAASELSVREAEEIVRRGKLLKKGGEPLTEDGVRRNGAATGRRPAKNPLRTAHLQDLEQRFERAVKTKVTIHEGRKRGSGRITIEYYSLDDFDRIAEKLGVEGE